MADISFRETTPVALAEGQPRRPWIGDAPADADEVLASVRVLPGWVCLLVAVGGALILWAAIFAALRWAFAQ